MQNIKLLDTYEQPTLRTSQPHISPTGLGYMVASPVLFVWPQKNNWEFFTPQSDMLYVEPAWTDETPKKDVE